MSQFSHFFQKIINGNLVLQILFGLLAGIALAWFYPQAAINAGLFGSLFLSALKAAAPILVFVLVTASIAGHNQGQKSNMRPILLLYLAGTFLAAVVAVLISFMFPTKLQIIANSTIDLVPPTSVIAVLQGLLLNIVDNPINALSKANFIGILAWSIGLGLALRYASDNTKVLFKDLADGVTYIVRVIIRFAPIGIFGLVASSLAETGFEQLKDYLHLLLVLVGAMLLVALVMNPLIVYLVIRRNPYPLLFVCLKESGITAFFTRSSAANVPVNLALSKKLGLNEETYSVSIPLGATINMAGAAVTITVLTLAAVHSLNIEVSPLSALLLSVVAAVCACGASGVAGGSLLLIPLACSLFNIDSSIAFTVVGIGMAIGIVQDSLETAINSSTDVLFTAAVCIAEEEKEQNSEKIA